MRSIFSNKRIKTSNAENFLYFTVKKAYYKLSLKYHPDKVSDDSLKEESTIKFQILGKIYSILSDDEKKKLYDECGVIDGEDNFSADTKDWDKHWRQFFKLSTDDIKHFFDKYKGSDEEKDDLFKLYEKSKGDMNLIMEGMFSSDVIEDEPRFREILEKAIEEGSIGKYAKFVSESKRKASKRKAHYEKEAKEAEELKKQMGLDEKSLQSAIMSRMSARKVESDSFLAQLEKKYGAKEKSGKKKGEPVFKLHEVEVDSPSEEEEEDSEEDDSASNKPSKKAKNGKRLNGKAAAKGKARQPVKRLS